LIRLLKHSDISDALVLSTAAGWNQTADDWSRLITLEPANCFCIEDGGQVVATSSLLVHSKDLAWVGMVLTHPDYRRRGYARCLLDSTLGAARALGIRSVKLDGTEAGEPIYRSLGFEVEQAIERWRREPGPVSATSDDVTPGDILFDLDAAAFGADRSRFLRELPAPHGRGSARGASVRAGSAYALHRPGSRARYFGPCVSRTLKDAEQLAVHGVAQHPDELWFWDILPANDNARVIAEALGFRPVRRLARMWLGENVRGDDSLVYATAGFEAG
jgi:GNAT superfamily N-acetyltransferase